MNFRNIVFKLALVVLIGFYGKTHAQNKPELRWTKDGNAYYQILDGELVTISLPESERKTIVSRDLLYSSGVNLGRIKDFDLSADGTKVLLYTNSKKVWRYETRGDYFVADLKANTLTQIGKGKPESSLMFAKFSPDGNKVAYVSQHNLYVDDLQSKSSKALTSDG